MITCPLTNWMQELVKRNNLYSFAITDTTFETITLGRHITKNYQLKYSVKGKAKFTQAIYALTRYIIHRLHQIDTWLNKQQIIAFFKSTIKKYSRTTIND